MEKKNKSQEIEKRILDIMNSGISLSITQITKELDKKYSLKISPQITKRYLLKLVKDGKIIQKNG